MKRFDCFFGVFFLAFVFFIAPSAKAQGTYTAASCNQSDVNAIINGPTHSAVNGDTIVIPTGSCSWTSSGITVRKGIGITITGNGTPSNDPSVVGASSSCSDTTITWTTSGNSMISVSPQYGNSTTRISCMNIVTTGSSCSGGGCAYPIVVNGTCTAAGCANIRVDNLTTPNGNMCSVSDGSLVAASNVFGVLDHNTIGTFPPSCNAPVLANVGHGSWEGVGSWGDNSWASPDTFGASQQLYLENNHIISGLLTDTDIGGPNGGGARQTCRFNTIDNLNSGGGCTGHGTDTTGRARGVRQWEAYWNTGVCSNTSIGCGSFVPGRSGVGRAFANSFSNNPTNAYFKGMADLGAQRRWRPDAPWGPCDGSAPWDTNQGTVYSSGTIGSISGAGNPWTVIDSVSPGWATNQWAQSPGAPYSIHDVTANGGFEIGSNTANLITASLSVAGSAGAYNPAAGDNFQILKALVCMDQPSRGAGLLVQNNSSGNPVLVSTGNPGPVNQTLDPTYEADDAEGSHADHTIQSQTAGLIANRDWYAESVNQSAQASPTSPFNGTSGTGHGILANRPTTCTTGVGYWATDQGTWNTHNSSQEGVLYTCTATNTWTLSYTPYSYPHPLITGGTTGGTLPNPPTALKATVQ